MLWAAQFAFAYYTIFSKPLFQKYSVYQITTYVFTVSAILFMIFCFKDVMKISWTQVSFEGWASILYSSIGGMCIGNSLWSYGVKKIGSAKAAVYLNLQPVFTIIVSRIFLNETFSSIQSIGAMAILAGVYIASMKSKKVRLRSIEEAR